MGATLDLTAFDAMMKEIYPDGVPAELAYRKHAFLSLVPKADDFEGDKLPVPVTTAGPQGRSADVAKAIANMASSKNYKFELTRAADYVAWQIQAETIYASRSNRGAFAQARKREGDLALKSLGNSLAHALYGDGTGALAEVLSVSSNTMTLKNARDTRFFYEGQVLIADDTSTGLSPRSGTMTVTVVDEDAGKVTVGTIVSGTAANDYLFAEGDASAKLKGLAAWLPLTAPTGGDSFFGVDRSPNPTRLAGTRLNTASAGIRENAITLLELVQERGGSPDYLLCSPGNFATLSKDAGGEVLRTPGGEAIVGFKSFEFQYSSGSAMLVPDPDCPANRIYAITLDSWKLHHLEGLPHIVRDDGRDALRGATTDTIQMRARYWAQLACDAPAHNGVAAV